MPPSRRGKKIHFVLGEDGKYILENTFCPRWGWKINTLHFVSFYLLNTSLYLFVFVNFVFLNTLHFVWVWFCNQYCIERCCPISCFYGVIVYDNVTSSHLKADFNVFFWNYVMLCYSMWKLYCTFLFYIIFLCRVIVCDNVTSSRFICNGTLGSVLHLLSYAAGSVLHLSSYAKNFNCPRCSLLCVF